MERTAHILVTRPLGQHADFIAMLQADGLSVCHLPCLQIMPTLDRWPDEDPLTDVDLVLFTSVNAVRQAHRLRPLPWSGVAVYAIGAATASELHKRGQTLAHVPEPPFDSETLLHQLPPASGRRLCLIKGVGGREVLAPALRERHWQVHGLDVYRREMPVYSFEQLETLLTRPTPDIISVTSNETLLNLADIAGAFLPLLQPLPLIVNSERAIAEAGRLGFSQLPMVARPPGDAGQLQCVRQWLQASRPDTPLHI